MQLEIYMKSAGYFFMHCDFSAKLLQIGLPIQSKITASNPLLIMEQKMSGGHQKVNATRFIPIFLKQCIS